MAFLTNESEPTSEESKENNGTLNDILKRLNHTQEKVYGYIKANPGVQAKHIIADLKMQRDTLNKVLRTLTDLHLIEHKDSKKTGGYYPLH